MKEEEARAYAARLRQLKIHRAVADSFVNDNDKEWGVRTRDSFTLYTSVHEFPRYWQQLVAQKPESE